ncbi:hypothetical protein GCM10018783_00350 [Streptomyces griseosporeus]|nr:hypothetical protein GCM10018783_00350 [Streptomyces griseosporeus]
MPGSEGVGVVGAERPHPVGQQLSEGVFGPGRIPPHLWVSVPLSANDLTDHIHPAECENTSWEARDDGRVQLRPTQSLVAQAWTYQPVGDLPRTHLPSRVARADPAQARRPRRRIARP